MQETNQLLLNYYKKEEMKKVRLMAENQSSLQEIFENVNMDRISKQDIINMLGEDYEELRRESLGISEEEMNEENSIYNYSNKNQNSANSLNVTKNTPMEIAKQYKSYFEEYRKDRKLICKSKKISNGTFQRYLRLNYLIPELQKLVNNKKFSLNVAEQISFLDQKNQLVLFEIIQTYDYKISERVAKKLKIDFKKNKDYILDKEKLEKYKNEKSVKIVFSQDEIQNYFSGIANIKEYIVGILNNIQAPKL